MNKYQKALNKLSKNVFEFNKMYDSSLSYRETRSFYKKAFKNTDVKAILTCNEQVIIKIKKTILGGKHNEQISKSNK